jgi:hypothetical protein
MAVASHSVRRASWVALATLLLAIAALTATAYLNHPADRSTAAQPSAQATAVVLSSATDPLPGGTQPPLNELEMKIITALGELGVSGQRAQLPFKDASIWAELGPGAQLFVNAYPLGTVDPNYTVVDERQLGGIRVQHVRRPGSPTGTITNRFECSGAEYWINGTVQPQFTDMDTFLGRFVRALGCSG